LRAAPAARGFASEYQRIFPRQRLIAKAASFEAASFQDPLPLPVGKQLQHRGGRFLDRSPRHVELYPIESCAQSPRKRDFIGDAWRST